MSDYLWDKTGEPEEDVERLEELLGRFRVRTRGLELPAESDTATPAVSRAPRPLRAAGFAVAAALLLAFTAGALFLLRRGAGEGRREQTQAASKKLMGEQRKDFAQASPSPSVAESGNDRTTPGFDEVVKQDERSGPDARDGQKGSVERAVKDEQTRKGESPFKDEQTREGEPPLKDERAARLVLPRNAERRQGVGEVALKQRGGVVVAGSRRNERGEVEGATRVVAESAAFEGGRAEQQQPLEERQRAAKDELMYVLRLTGLKLKEVQKKTQKVDGWKSAFDQQK